MATILRSSKYIRCLNVLAQRLVIAHENNKFVTKSLALQVQSTNSYLTKSYATLPATQKDEHADGFEKLINKLDENVQRYGRVFKQEVDATLSKLRESGYISSLDALLLIRCCGELLIDTVLEERNKLSQEIWTTLETLKIRLDVSHFNALLRVYLENNYEFSPIEFLTLMRDKQIEPNRITYQRLMLYHCKKGDIDGATKILEVMREKGLPLNEGVFNALIRGYSEANDIESAKNVLNVMTEAGVEPSSSTYTALLCAYAKIADMDSMKQILMEFESKNLYLQNNDVFEIIHVLADNGHNDKTNQFFAIMPRGPGYNVDAAHAILKVLDGGNIDIAMKILSTMAKRTGIEEDTVEYDSGTFLIRKLVNSKYPLENIVKACEELQQAGQHTRPFSVAVERSLENGDIKLSIKLMEEWMKHGGEIREHYFWPILAIFGNSSNYQGIIDTVKLMSSSFQIIPGLETIKDYILPYVLGEWDDIILTLKELEISHSTIISAIANKMLHEGRIRKTFTFMANYPGEYQAEHFYRPLFEVARGDPKSYAMILRCLCNTAVNSNESAEHGESVHVENVVDNAIRFLIQNSPSENYENVDKILEHLEQVGLSISPEVGFELRQYFQDNMSPIKDKRIEQLTSGSLTPVPIEDLAAYIIPGVSGDGSVHDGRARQKHRQAFATKRQLLSTALAEDDLATVQNIIAELKSLDFIFSPGLCAQIIDIACVHGNMEMAENWINNAQANPDGFSLDLPKIIKYATLLIQNDRHDEAVQFIRNTPRKNIADNSRMGAGRLIKKLLDTSVQSGNVEKTTELFDTLVEVQYMVVDNYFLGALVKVHLTQNNLESALEAFEKACKNHRCTPMKGELSKKFIDAEDASSLQKLTDLSTEIHGESNSLIDLVGSFLECGRLRQARKILETPGLRLRGGKLTRMIEQYVEDGHLDYLEQFADITKGLPVMNRREFYDVLMNAYNKKNNWQQGLMLWTTIQDEDLQPSDEFSITLAHLLRRNDQPVPFNYNEITKNSPNLQEKQNPEQSFLNEFYRALDRGKVEEAEKCLQTVSPKHKAFKNAVCSLAESFVTQKNDLDKACALVEDLIVNKDQYPRAATLKTIWNSCINNEEFEKLRKHGSVLSETMKETFRFNKYLNRAILKEVGLTEFLTDFESKITDSKTDNVRITKNNLHFPSLIEELKKDPKAMEKFHQLAEKLCEQEIYSPINLVWCYYFEQDHPEADAIWDKYLSNADRLMFKYITNTSKYSNNIELMERLYKKLQQATNLSTNLRINAVSTLIELYHKNSRYEDAMDLIESSQPEVRSTWIKKNPVIYEQCKESLKANGKSFSILSDDTSLAGQ